MPASTDGNLDGNTGAEREHIFVVKYNGILTGIFQALAPEKSPVVCARNTADHPLIRNRTKSARSL